MFKRRKEKRSSQSLETSALQKSFSLHRRKQLHYLLEGKGKKTGIGGEESSDNRRNGGESTARATLNYLTKDFQMEKLEVGGRSLRNTFILCYITLDEYS